MIIILINIIIIFYYDYNFINIIMIFDSDYRFISVIRILKLVIKY